MYLGRSEIYKRKNWIQNRVLKNVSSSLYSRSTFDFWRVQRQYCINQQLKRILATVSTF